LRKVYRKLKYFVDKNIFSFVLARQNNLLVQNSQDPQDNSVQCSNSMSYAPGNRESSLGSQLTNQSQSSSRTELHSHRRESSQGLSGLSQKSMHSTSSRFLYRAYVFSALTEKIGCTEQALEYLYRRYNQVWPQNHYKIDIFPISQLLAPVKLKKVEDLAFAMLNAYDKHPIIVEVLHLFYFTISFVFIYNTYFRGMVDM
jgi:hypothetical protein